jgi:ABC-type transport system involved in multi-copper enzyme maturation permease subunit
LSAAAEPAAATPAALRAPRPSFAGSVGSELLKLARQGMVWTMLGIALLLFGVIAAAIATAPGIRPTLDQQPPVFMFTVYEIYLAVFDAGSGIFLLVVSARLVGIEYSGGTIRVLLARGAGRLRLLLAKVTALALLGLAMLAGFLLLVTATLYATVVGWEGSFARIASLSGTVWTDLGIQVLVALTSMAVCILLGTAAAVAGRSVAFGLGAALALFPIDNFATFALALLNAATGWHVWLDVSTFLLGPNLNILPVLLQTDHRARTAFATPLVTVGAAHAWLVVAAWAAALAVASVALTRRRDVLQ